MKESILAFLIGIGGTQNLGEKNYFGTLTMRMENPDFRYEIGFDSSDKIESPGGKGSLRLDFKHKYLLFGGYFSYRWTNDWTKYAGFITVGLNSKRVEGLLAYAVISQNNEIKLELRVKSKFLELHSYYLWYTMTSNELDHRFGVGAELALRLAL